MEQPHEVPQSHLPASVPTANIAAAADLWWYINQDGVQAGPEPEVGIFQLLNQDMISLQTLVWRNGMNQWQKLSDVEALSHLTQSFVAKEQENKAAATANDTAAAAVTNSGPMNPDAVWYYIDNYRVQQGPVTKALLKQLYQGAQVSVVTLAWRDGQEKWAQIGQISELADVCRSAGAAAAATGAGAGAKRKSAEPDQPMVDENGDPLSPEDIIEAARKREEKREKRRKKKEEMSKWKSMENHSNVYVQGLPLDVTVPEVFEHFKKCGIIREGADGRPRVKLYKDDQDKLKGDALVTYLMPESVALAVQILDDSLIRPDCHIKVSKAEFQMKGSTFQKKKKEKMVDKVKLKTAKAAKALGAHSQLNKLSWDDDEESKKGLRIVILKHMFTLEEASKAPSKKEFYDELRVEVGRQIEEECGQVEKLTVFEGNAEGVIAVKFVLPSAATQCIATMDGRFFAGRKIECAFFDGETNYKAKETEDDTKERLEAFGEWLENQSSDDDDDDIAASSK